MQLREVPDRQLLGCTTGQDSQFLTDSIIYNLSCITSTHSLYSHVCKLFFAILNLMICFHHFIQ